MKRGYRKDMVGMAASMLVVALLTQGAPAGEAPVVRAFSLTAVRAFEEGMGAWGTKLNEFNDGVILYDHVLIEDDGPGIGSDNQWLEKGRGPVEKIGGPDVVRKVLNVERPQAMMARLYVPRGVSIEVNGTPVETDPKARYPEIPVSLLKKGDNEVVLSCPADAETTLKVATREDIVLNDPDRRDRPGRSFKSLDGGNTWQPIEGECMVRLHLVQYVEQGRVVSPVLDLAAAGDDDRLPLSRVSVASLTLKPEARLPEGTNITYTVRTGTSAVYDAELWTDWRTPEEPTPAGHRYLQWQATLRTASATQTPLLKAVRVEAAMQVEPQPAWAKALSVTDLHNEQIRYSSIPFIHEDFQHPKLVELRKKYKLDEVVAGADSELERLVKLRDWVAHQWKYKPPSQEYPPWDADDILQRKYGFCVQYAIVYVQCCLSLGYPARFVFGIHSGLGSGHEVTEVWSNEYRKWIFMDPNGNRHQVDPKTNGPLSMLETHERMVKAYYGDKPVDHTNTPSKPAGSSEIATCRGLELVHSETPKDGEVARWPPWRKWLHVYYVPRSDFYARRYPLPKIQGWNWDWTGYWSWNPGYLSPAWKYRNITGRRSDIDWTINQVHFGAAYGDNEGTINVGLGTVTPGFETFLIRIDDGQWTPSGRTVAWKLHDGENRLEMRVRNTTGVLGPVSFVKLGYENKTK